MPDINVSPVNSPSDLSGVDPTTAVEMVMFDYMNQANGLLKGAVTDAQNQNGRINQINAMVTSIRDKRPSGASDTNDLSQAQCDWLSENGITDSNGKPYDGRQQLMQGQFDQILTSCQSISDSASNLSQEMQLTVQSMSNKSNQATDMISNLDEKDNTTLSNVITNMR